MPEQPSNSAFTSYDYAVIRVIPSISRGECLNAGVILFCRTRRFLDACIELNRDRLSAIAPAHLNLDKIEAALYLIPAIARGAGPIGALPLADRFHWLTSPRNTIIQPSAIHCGRCQDPSTALDHLLEVMVR